LKCSFVRFVSVTARRGNAGDVEGDLDRSGQEVVDGRSVG